MKKIIDKNSFEEDGKVFYSAEYVQELINRTIEFSNLNKINITLHYHVSNSTTAQDVMKELNHKLGTRYFDIIQEINAYKTLINDQANKLNPIKMSESQIFN